MVNEGRSHLRKEEFLPRAHEPLTTGQLQTWRKGQGRAQPPQMKELYFQHLLYKVGAVGEPGLPGAGARQVPLSPSGRLRLRWAQGAQKG